MDILQYKIRDTNIPKREKKENVPDGSKRQKIKLSRMCQRQETLLREERVSKTGYTAVGVWHPGESIVEVIVEKGKFWHVMGFHQDDKKWLKPYEALYLVDTSCMDLQYHGITMSLQQAYSALIPKMISLEFYQVYSYLMRLGYIIEVHKSLYADNSKVSRMSFSCESTNSKEGKLKGSIYSKENLKRTSDMSESIDVPSKRTHHQSPDEASIAVAMAMSNKRAVTMSGKVSSECISAEEEIRTSGSLSVYEESETSGHLSLYEESETSCHLSESHLKRPLKPFQSSEIFRKKIRVDNIYSCWDFRKINLPNIMDATTCIGGANQSHLTKLLSSHESLQAVSIPLNSQTFWDVESKPAKEKVADSGGLLNFTSSPINWGEYKLLKEKENDLYPALKQSAVSHMWDADVHPLVKPSDAMTTSSLMKKLQIIENADLVKTCNVSSDKQDDIDDKVHFKVYLPESNYKKTAPGKAVIYIIVAKSDEETPRLQKQVNVLQKASGTPLVWAVVDNGDISFYTLKDLNITQGIRDT